MAIFVDEHTRLVVQGITGSAGAFHARQMMDYGTQVVAGVVPGKGGQRFEDRVPIFDTVGQSVREAGANTSVVYVPPPFAADAIMEAAAAGIRVVIAITEGIPVLDMMRVRHFLADYPHVRLIGPNCPGVITPGTKTKVGIMPAHIHLPGRVGVVSRSGTLTYEAVGQLTALGIGQSTCVGIGGDPINGTNFIDVLSAFQATRHRRRHHDRRDRRHRRGAGRGLDRRSLHQAHRGLHRRPHRAARQAHGPRRRHHLGRQRHGMACSAVLPSIDRMKFTRSLRSCAALAPARKFAAPACQCVCHLVSVNSSSSVIA
jgi:succinyl-CoA synthetase alpha subunit